MIGLDQTFSLLKIVTQKDACAVLSGTWRLTLIQKGGLCPLSWLPLMTEFSVFMPLPSIAPGTAGQEAFLWRTAKFIWRIKISEMKTK